jgi:hypothetical protein
VRSGGAATALVPCLAAAHSTTVIERSLRLALRTASECSSRPKSSLSLAQQWCSRQSLFGSVERRCNDTLLNARGGNRTNSCCSSSARTAQMCQRHHAASCTCQGANPSRLIKRPRASLLFRALPLVFTLWCEGRFEVKDPLGSHLCGCKNYSRAARRRTHLWTGGRTRHLQT